MSQEQEEGTIPSISYEKLADEVGDFDPPGVPEEVWILYGKLLKQIELRDTRIAELEILTDDYAESARRIGMGDDW